MKSTRMRTGEFSLAFFFGWNRERGEVVEGAVYLHDELPRHLETSSTRSHIHQYNGLSESC